MSKNIPFISIILTSYNHANFIRYAIESTLNQTFQDFELIIWDDASSDNSWEIIESYKDSRIVSFQNPERLRGIYNINKAIKEVARGKYIAIHHSDDVWEIDKLQKQFDFLESNSDFGAVFTKVRIINEEGSDLENKDHPYQKIFEQPNRNRFEWLRFFIEYGNALCHPSVMVRKSVYEAIGGYTYGLAQIGDFDCWIRMCQKYEIHVLQEKLVHFRVLNNEKNSSGIRSDTIKRSYFESMLVYDSFCQLSVNMLLSIFPEITNSNYNIEKNELYLLLVKHTLIPTPLKYNLLRTIVKSFNHSDNLSLYRKIIHETVRATGEIDILREDLLSEKIGLFSTIFVDTGSGFSESTVVQKTIIKNLFSFTIDCDLSEFSNIRFLRFDPFENHWGYVKIKTIKLIAFDNNSTDIDLNILQSNASSTKMGEFLFETHDPIIWFPISQKIKNVKIVGDWHFFNPMEIDEKYIALKKYVGGISTIFIDAGNGIISNVSKCHMVDLNKNDFYLEYSLGEFRYIKELRFDPFENHWGSIKFESIKIINDSNEVGLYDLTKIHSNAKTNYNGELYFENSDPMIYVPIFGSIKKIVFIGKWNLIGIKGIEEKYNQLIKDGDGIATIITEDSSGKMKCEEKIIYIEKRYFKIRFNFPITPLLIKEIKFSFFSENIKILKIKAVYNEKTSFFKKLFRKTKILTKDSEKKLIKNQQIALLFSKLLPMTSLKIDGKIHDYGNKNGR